uniref:P-type domain-containing protein n=2 Tax=Parascaris univalens TaxID=6257 RepID=A0A914ZIJ3_PARUN
KESTTFWDVLISFCEEMSPKTTKSFNTTAMRCPQLSLLTLFVCGTCVGGQLSTVDSKRRVDCFPDPNASSASCEKRGCIWDTQNYQDTTVPLCYFPSGTGYSVFNVSDDEILLTKENSSGNAVNPFGKDISPLKFRKQYYGSTLNIRIEPSSASLRRFEPDIDLLRGFTYSSDSLYVETTTQGIFSFSVKRRSTNVALWNTSLGGGLMFADQYIQLATYFASNNVYGFGENVHHTLKHNLNKYTTWGMLARDEGPNAYGESTNNLYGVYAFYVCVENDGNAHGAVIVNSNPQDITTGPGPHMVYRTIGGMLDIYFFPGPTPEEVIQQYEALVGKPMMPAYWALGFQLSRYGYANLSDQQAIIKRNREAGIPLDAPHFDIDYMNRNMDFTTGQNWQGLGGYVRQLQQDGLHVVLIFDPAIDVISESFTRAVEKDVAFIEWPRDDLVQTEIQNLYNVTNGTKIMLGVVWPDRHTAFPDFSDLKPNTVEWWVDEYRRYHKSVPFDGLWIDMNEPANFGTNEEEPWYFGNDDHPNIEPLNCSKSNASDRQWDYPPYKTHSAYFYGSTSELASKTLCMLATTRRGQDLFYNTKNLYGLYEAKATLKAVHEVTQKRGIVLSRSTFPGAGRYAGHWLGDNQAIWEALRVSAIGVQEFNMFGIPYVGSDICGYSGNAEEEMCLRWHQLGAFHPFSRNHNNNNAAPQDPAQWPTVAEATREANLFRYRYLPYLYSLHFASSIAGGTVVRPVFFEFPRDNQTYDLGLQFMWGPGLMIVPVTEQGAETVSAYLPTSATWYSLRDGDYGETVFSGNMRARKTEMIPVLARGGVIIPRQPPETTTTASRRNPFDLLIAIDPSNGTAAGFLYWDDGESVISDFGSYPFYEFRFTFTTNAESSKLTIMRISNGNIRMPTLDSIDVLGLPYAPNMSTVKYMEETVDMTQSSYDESKKLFKIRKQGMIALDEQPTIAELIWSTNGLTKMSITRRPSTLAALLPLLRILYWFV